MFRKISYTLILILYVSCSSQKIFFKGENIISKINPDNNQSEFIQAKIDTISSLTNRYNESKETDENSLKQKMDILSEIMDKIMDIKEILSEEQSKALSETELVHYTLQSARDVSLKYHKKYEIAEKTEIPFSENHNLSDKDINVLWKKRSIRIGGSRSANFRRAAPSVGCAPLQEWSSLSLSFPLSRSRWWSWRLKWTIRRSLVPRPILPVRQSAWDIHGWLNWGGR